MRKGELTRMARNPKTRPEMLRRLASKRHPQILRALAQNPSAPPEVLEALAQNPNPSVRVLVARNPNTPPGVLLRLFEEAGGDFLLQYFLAKNPNTPPGVLEGLLGSKYPAVRVEVERNLRNREV